DALTMINAKKSSWKTPNVWGFSLASLFSDLGHEMVTALLPGFLLSIGAPPIALGLIEGVSNWAQSLASIWGGLQADRNPHRNRIVFWGYVLTGIKALIATVTFWPWLILLRTVAWLGRGARGPIRNTFIAEEVSPQDRGKAFGFREMFDTLGAVAGPLLATFLLTYTSYRTLIAWSVVPAIITVLVIAKWVHDPSPIPPSTADRTGTVDHMPWPPAFRRLRWAVLAFSAGYLAPTFFILRVITSHPPYALGLRPAVLALALYTVHNIAYALGSYPAGVWSDRRNGKTVLTAGSVLWTLVLIGFLLTHNNILMWTVLFIGSGLATALIETGQKTWAVHIIPSPVRGKGLGQIAGLGGIGQLAASGAAGILWTWVSPASAFGATAVLAGVGSVLFAWTTAPPYRDV
ncbi:MAG: MFS transporter, partial [Sulfobacillus sp.]